MVVIGILKVEERDFRVHRENVLRVSVGIMREKMI